ncbi:opacity protein-like surface antigen [Bradyrhizobium sp. JR7.2]
MKHLMLTAACVFALATTSAYAQTSQPAPGASGQGEVGPSAAGTK